jgi:hypothetical protein
MKPNSDPIRRLFRLARQARPDPPSMEQPTAFATRVLACVRKPPQTPWWEYLALRAALAGCAAAGVCWLAQPVAPGGNEPAQLAAWILDVALQP